MLERSIQCNLVLVILCPIAITVLVVLISLKYANFHRPGEIDYLFFICSFVTCTATVLDIYGVAFPQLTVDRPRGMLRSWQNPWQLGTLLLVLGLGMIFAISYQEAQGRAQQAGQAATGQDFGKMVWNLTLIIATPFLLLVPSSQFDHLVSTRQNGRGGGGGGGGGGSSGSGGAGGGGGRWGSGQSSPSGGVSSGWGHPQKLRLWLWTTASVVTVIITYHFGHFFARGFVQVTRTPEHKFMFVLVFDWTLLLAKLGFGVVTRKADEAVLATFSGSHGVTKLHRHRISNRAEICYTLVRYGFYYSIFTEVTDLWSFVAVELATFVTNVLGFLLMASKHVYLAAARLPVVGRLVPTEEQWEWQQGDGEWRRYDAAANALIKRVVSEGRQREVEFEGADGARYHVDLEHLVQQKEMTIWTGKREMSTTRNSDVRMVTVLSRQWLYQHQQQLFFRHWCQGLAQLIAALQFMICIGVILQQHYRTRTDVGPQYVIFSLIIGGAELVFSNMLLGRVLGPSNTPSGVAMMVIHEDCTTPHQDDDSMSAEGRKANGWLMYEILYSFTVFASHIITDIDYGVVSRQLVT